MKNSKRVTQKGTHIMNLLKIDEKCNNKQLLRTKI